MKTLLFLLLSSLSSLAYSSTPAIDTLTWTLKKDTDNIQVFSAKVPDSAHRAILSVSTLDANIDTLVSVLRAPEKCSEWVHRCYKSYLYEQKNPQEDLVYTANKMPFPTKNRDILAHIIWETEAETNIVRATGTATKNILPHEENHTRIEDAKMIWELTPLDNGQTKVRSFAHVDPAGGLPAWLTNQLSVNIPVKTLKGLQEITNKAK